MNAILNCDDFFFNVISNPEEEKTHAVGRDHDELWVSSCGPFFLFLAVAFFFLT